MQAAAYTLDKRSSLEAPHAPKIKKDPKLSQMKKTFVGNILTYNGIINKTHIHYEKTYMS